MPNYRKKTRTAFKDICSSDKYKNKAILEASMLYEKINKDYFKIGEKKIEEYLEDLKIEEKGEVKYKNPYIWPVVSNLTYYFTNPMGVMPPMSIESSEKLQKECGRRPEEVSEMVKKIQHVEVTPDILISLAREFYPDKIKKGVDGYWYVKPD